MTNPLCILLFSGKRKSGKDYITEKLYQTLGNDKCEVIHISQPIKAHWAQSLGLNLKELLSDGVYKEKYRAEMVTWSENVRKQDYGYFCRAACETAAKKYIWIVADIRRKTDIKWFKEVYSKKIKTVRIFADDDVRIQRGWKYTKGIDDAETECDLDEVIDWDFKIINNSTEQLQKHLQEIYSYINDI